MRITCPHCGAHYDVPEAKLVGRKAVRCSRCGTDWTPIAPPIAEEDPPVRAELPAGAETELIEQPAHPIEAPQGPQPSLRLERRSGEFTAMQRLARSTEAPSPSVWARVAWGLSLVLVALMLWSAVNWRSDIMRIWPPSTRAYAALGLTPQPR